MAAGFEVTRNLPIYSDGKSDYKGQIGQTYIVSLSPEITNGPKVFRLDDLEVPFDINVKGLKPVKSKE